MYHFKINMKEKKERMYGFLPRNKNLLNLEFLNNIPTGSESTLGKFPSLA